MGSVWVCNSSSANCALAANFNCMHYIAFSYKTGVNKGYVLNIPGIMNGSSTDAMEIIHYDLGSASATPSWQALTASSILGSWQGMASHPSWL